MRKNWGAEKRGERHADVAEGKVGGEGEERKRQRKEGVVRGGGRGGKRRGKQNKKMTGGKKGKGEIRGREERK